MNLSRSDYAVERSADGSFYAYLKSNILCTAYGETPDEACENLNDLIEDFVSDMYMVEEFI